jgi:hypothetical protein
MLDLLLCLDKLSVFHQTLMLCLFDSLSLYCRTQPSSLILALTVFFCYLNPFVEFTNVYVRIQAFFTFLSNSVGKCTCFWHIESFSKID